MHAVGLCRIEKSGTFAWPWDSRHGLLIVQGAAGGGGGGGGSCRVEGLTIFGADGGKGGGGGRTTLVEYKQKSWQAGGGNGGAGGDGGGLDEGKPVAGAHGTGCRHGDGGDGGNGGKAILVDGNLASDGGDGGRGFPGETLIVELDDMSVGDRFKVSIGDGGEGGLGGQGHNSGEAGGKGADGAVVFVPLLERITGDD